MQIRLAHASIALVVATTVAVGQTTTRVSVGSSGGQANGTSANPSVSADGRYVAFHSNATNLDSFGVGGLFVRDCLLGFTERVCTTASGGPADGDHPSVSADGRFVAFESASPNLVVGDTNSATDIFVRDRQAGTTERVSVATGGAEADAGGYAPSLSADGRFVAFSSYATNLVSGDANGTGDVFVHDRFLGTTERVSVDSTGAQGNGDTYGCSVSSDGRFVTFYSGATNLVAGDTNGAWDIFVRDRLLGTTERVSVATGGAQANEHSEDPSISADGRFVAFWSNATNLIAGDTNGASDIFVRDRQQATTERASVDSNGSQAIGGSSGPSISSDGRFVVFWSGATNLVSGDWNAFPDVFIRDRQFGKTQRVSLDSGGAQADNSSYVPSVSADGRFVAFTSDASNLVAGDTNADADVFLRDRGSQDCNNNGIDDAQDIQSGTSSDCDGNWIPDECDLVQEPALDCDANGLIDSCEITADPSLDLNHDGSLDICPLNCQPFWQTYLGGRLGMDAAIRAMIVYDDGTGPALYAGGSFHSAEGVLANGIAKWDGVTWAPLGSGVTGGEIRALAVYDDGGGPALYAGGTFTSAGGVPADRIAKWDGTSWSPLGVGLSGEVNALAVCDFGSGAQLYAAGAALSLWDGNTWSLVPIPWTYFVQFIADLVVFDDGSGPALYVGCEVSPERALVARWDGASWSQLTGVIGQVASSLVVHDDGSGPALYAGTWSLNWYDGRVWKWNGSSWVVVGILSGHTSGDGTAWRLRSVNDAGGSALYVGGSFLQADGVPAINIARWDGTSWSGLAGGTDDGVRVLCAFDDGGGSSLYVGGDFSTVNYLMANHIASWGLPGGCVPTGTVVCEPGTNGVIACPCSNPPTTAGRGCNNSSGTGGAQLTTSGFARLGTDNLVLTTSGEKPGASSIVLQGSVSSSTGFTFGQGVRCVSGSLKRLYLKTAIAGSITAPGASDLSVSARSAALGSPIAPGMHRYYGVYYRDPVILGGCPAASGFNITQQLDVLWHP